MVDYQEQLEQKVRVLTFVGFMMVLGVMAFSIFGLMSVRGSYESALSSKWQNILKYSLLTVAVLDVYAIRFLNWFILSKNKSSELKLSRMTIEDAFKNLSTATLMSLVLCEKIALLGFALLLINKVASEYYLFLTLSLVAFWYYFPRTYLWEDYIKAKVGVKK